MISKFSGQRVPHLGIWPSTVRELESGCTTQLTFLSRKQSKDSGDERACTAYQANEFAKR
jgi:hypothetical protein